MSRMGAPIFSIRCVLLCNFDPKGFRICFTCRIATAGASFRSYSHTIRGGRQANTRAHATFMRHLNEIGENNYVAWAKSCSRADFSRVEDKNGRAVETRLETGGYLREWGCRGEIGGHACGCGLRKFVDGARRKEGECEGSGSGRRLCLLFQVKPT